jgi:alkanesulfonate monooxygenase SsuD/methylene tetrahydromethanopterin reductase-like flavin-dependent oxidoreductase (luciferase family)
MTRFSLFSVLDYYEDGSRTIPALYEQCLDQIVEAERLGFDAYWIGEHHGYLTPHHTLACPNPAVLLSTAAQRTQCIGLNTAVANLALRHPLLVAEDYALVDLLSNGRLGLGIGRGSFAHEYTAFGQNREESRGRFEESWEIIQRAWRGETVTFQGRYYQLNGAKLNVLPVQKPLPRYWFSAIRGESFAMLGRTAQPVISLPHLTADGLPTLAKLVNDYRYQYLMAGGDDSRYELPLIFYTFVAPTREEAQRLAGDALHRYLVHHHHGVDDQHLRYAMQQFQERDQLWFGTPGDLIELLEKYQANMDNRHFVFWLDFGGMKQELVQRSMQLLAREVIPHFRRSNELSVR